MIPILVPLFCIRIPHSANDLAMAMEARCYRGGDGRTKMKPLIYKSTDHVAYLITILYVVAAFVVGRYVPFKLWIFLRSCGMRRIRLTVAYDGTNYCGWQIQPNGITIEEVLNKAICKLTGEETQVIGASRTDAGVHARGNIAVFDTESRIPAGAFLYALNQRLPKDIVVVRSDEVDLTWHPRYQDTLKTYEYHIINTKVPIPTEAL